MANQNVAGATDRFDYAANVVTQSLKSSTPAWFWYGSFTRMIWFLDTFGWRTVWVCCDQCRFVAIFNITDLCQDSMLWKMFDLAKLKQAHAARISKEARANE